MIARSGQPPVARIWQCAAAAWGFAEATLFFIVPDVLLSLAVLRFGWRRAVALAVATACGALVGGALMYAWGSRDAGGAEEALDLVPAIAPGMIATAREAMTGAWPFELFVGSVSGTPYKVYAVEAGAAGLNLVGFLGVSAAARFARFAGTILLTELGRRILAAIGQTRRAQVVLSGFWLCLYAAYFWLMPT